MAALCVLATISAVPSKAAVVFESASFTGIDTGEYIVQDGRFIGAAFTVTQTTAITGIGAQFGGFPDGTIFGAIVLSSPTAFPSFLPSQLACASLARFVPGGAPNGTPPTDITEPLSVVLVPGSYGVVFGSGLFGAAGNGGLGFDNTTIGSPFFFQSLFSDEWQTQDPNGIRVFVLGSAVPEPATWAMMLLGFAGLCFAFRQSRRKVSFN
jgi:hypothetical protein